MMDPKYKQSLRYGETLTYLISLMANGMRLDLAPFSHLLGKLGQPHLAYNTILVGGTNGKGSVASIVAAIMRESGCRTGLYTSPHLVDVRERIAVNGGMITPQEFTDVVAIIKAAEDPRLTYFECLTAAAFLHFQRQQVDLAILEVGMGGRLDATNIAQPLLSVITNVTLEHTQYLGRHLRDIANEKAGIIRERGLCLTAAMQKAVRGTLRERCRDLGATLLELGKDFKVRRQGKEGAFSYTGPNLKINQLQTALKGSHQVRNAALALAVVESLAGCGYPVSVQHIRTGLVSVAWPGRLEVVARKPSVILDGAHNPAAVTALCDALVRHFIWKKLIVIFGVLQDKNYRIMLKRLASLADIIILTEPETERSVKPDALLPLAAAYCPQAEIAARPVDALGKALALADPEDLICVVGSLYLVGEIKAVLMETTIHRQ